MMPKTVQKYFVAEECVGGLFKEKSHSVYKFNGIVTKEYLLPV